MDDPRPDAPQLELTTPPAPAEDALQLGPADAAAVDPPAGDNPFAMQTTPPAVPAARADAPPMKASKPVTAAANDSVVAALMGRSIAKAQGAKAAATASSVAPSSVAISTDPSNACAPAAVAARAADRGHVAPVAASDSTVEESTARAVASDVLETRATRSAFEASVAPEPTPSPLSPDEPQDNPDPDEAAILAHLIDVAGVDADETSALPETDVVATAAPARPSVPILTPSTATVNGPAAPLRLPAPPRRAVPVAPVWPKPAPVIPAGITAAPAPSPAAVTATVSTSPSTSTGGSSSARTHPARAAAKAPPPDPRVASPTPATPAVPATPAKVAAPVTPAEVAGSTGAWFTIPLLFVGISVIACAILVPAADENRRDTYELARMEQDVDYFKRQSDVNADFLRRVTTDAALAERLAMRQLHQTRAGTRLAPLTPPTERFGMSPYAMTRLDPPAALPPYAPTRGILSEYFLDARRQTKTVALGVLLAGVGLLLGGTGRPRLVRPATPIPI